MSESGRGWGSPGGDKKIENPIAKWRMKMEEKKIGEVMKFFGKINVAAIKLSEGSLKVGDTIHIVGHTTDVTQTVDSMQSREQKCPGGRPRSRYWNKVKDRMREHDVVY